VYVVAEALGKYPHEIAQVYTVQDINYWVAYLNLKEDRIEQAVSKGK